MTIQSVINLFFSQAKSLSGCTRDFGRHHKSRSVRLRNLLINYYSIQLEQDNPLDFTRLELPAKNLLENYVSL